MPLVDENSNVDYEESKGQEKREGDPPMMQQEDILRLVDSQNNQYVLSKSKDTTVPIEDEYLVKVSKGCSYKWTFLFCFDHPVATFSVTNAIYRSHATHS